MYTRRHLLGLLTAAGAAGLAAPHIAVAAEPPPETVTLRIARGPLPCLAPIYVAEKLLRGEEFTDVRYIATSNDFITASLVAKGDLDVGMAFTVADMMAREAGNATTVLAGLHIGCFELVANANTRGLLDLKGKRVGVNALRSGGHAFIASMMTQVGLDPVKDIEWIVGESPSQKDSLVAGKIDPFLAFPPETQSLRKHNIGHIIVNSGTDRPWSQYFCCLLLANGTFVRERPVATKRALRAFLKATDLCANQPAQAARSMFEGGFTPRYDDAFQMLRELSYGVWREYDPEDTLRFYALRLREAGMIASTPQKIIASGADWRFLNELKRELKA